MTLTQINPTTFQIVLDTADLHDLTRYANDKSLSIRTVIFDLMVQNLGYIADYILTNSGD